MVITDISAQRRKGRFNLCVDGQFYSGIDEMAIVQWGLKKGQEIEEKKLKDIVRESETRCAFDRALNLLSVPRPKKDVVDKLIKYGFSAEVAKLAADKAEQYNYINDSEYARMMVEAYKTSSKLELKNKMFKKGLSPATISAALEGLDEGSEQEKAKAVAQKYMKNKEPNQKTLLALKGHLARKGFSMAATRKAVEAYSRGEDYDWD